ncbi:MlaE family lipid ABC transporter permease subunit [bacterium]|nr:MlaE family lipid ABC transporter permease subunit [bacterium]
MRRVSHPVCRFADSTVSVDAPLTKDTVPGIYAEIDGHRSVWEDTALTLDLSAVTRIDSAGVALIETLRSRVNERGGSLTITGGSKDVLALIETFTVTRDGKRQPRPKRRFFEGMGEQLYTFWQHLGAFFILVADTAFYSVQGMFTRSGMRKGEFTKQCIFIGMNALPIVGLISFLIGFILALQSAAQLRQFGASIYVADLVAISMTREMGPIMTAIALAGRSGSAFASEIANMVVTEETDALKTMGLNPIQYIVVPKMYAITVTTPMLTILSMLIGIFGSLVIGVTYLDLSVGPFMDQVANALILRDVIIGLAKSVIFAWIIITVGAYFGFTVSGGAEGVGRATTASVVTSIFMVILADSILGLIFYFGGGAF